MSLPSLRLVPPPPAPWEQPVGALAPTHPPGTGTGPRPRRGLDRLMLASDVLAVAAACCATGLLVVLLPSLGPTASGIVGRVAFLAPSAALVITVLAIRGGYSAARRRLAAGVADDLLGLEAGVALAGLLLLAAGSLAPVTDHLSDGGVAVLVGTSLLFVPASRALALALAARDGSRVTRVIVVGSGRVAGDLAGRLGRSPLVEVIGTVDDDPRGDADVLGSVDELPALCRAAMADRVVIAFSRRHPARSAELVLALRDVVEVDVVVRYFELAGWESRLHDVAGLSLLNLGRRPGRAVAAAKRSLDIVVAAAGLLALVPLLGLVALVVLATSGRPVFFRQVRVGRDKQAFHIVKFRTMRVAPPAIAVRQRTVFDTPDLDRITPVGQLLRRAALDELPQLWNVLLGQMSLVGPRPFVPEECDRLLGWGHRRFDVRPGLTGMWQVCGQHEVSFDELCRLDVQYATSWSLRTDLRILARTPTRLVHGSAPGR
ncbi:MAG: exopolysaccharide biosynthesis polyprenyl glycosylphosphotransferase [Acidimicrobiales bacterium]